MDFRDLKVQLWADGVGDLTFAPLTAADVRRAETTLDVRLPVSYLELLSVRNGGYVSSLCDAFPTAVPTSWAEDHVCFETLAGIGPADAWPSVTMSRKLAIDGGMPPGLVLLSGDGHYWIALDYRRAPDSEPSVVWIDREIGQDIALAPDFLTFLEGLVPMESFDDEELRIVHVVRGTTDATYCGLLLDSGVDWVAEERVDAAAGNACPDCLRLREEWDAIRRG